MTHVAIDEILSAMPGSARPREVHTGKIAKVEPLADALWESLTVDHGVPKWLRYATQAELRTLAADAYRLGQKDAPTRAAEVWSPGNPNDGTYEYVEVGDCDGTSPVFQKRRPAMHAEATRWEAAIADEYAAAKRIDMNREPK